jgi:hypothetical protein
LLIVALAMISNAVCHCEEGIDLETLLPSSIRTADTICGRLIRVYSASKNGLSDHCLPWFSSHADIDHENDQVP